MNEIRILGEANQAEELRLEWVIVEPDETLSSLLTTRGVEPNAGSLALVYELNPELHDADRIATGTEVLLPRVEARGEPQITFEIGFAPEASEAFRNRALNVAGVLQQRLSWERAALYTPGVAEQRLLEETAPRAAVQREFLGRLSSIRDLLIDLAAHAAWVPRDATDVLTSASYELARIVEAGARADAEGADPDASGLERLEDQLKSLAECSRAGLNCKVPYEVTTRRPDRTERPGLRIFYQDLYQYLPPRTFDQISSPTVQSLTIADYVVWAEDENGNPVSDVEELKVRRCGTSVCPRDLLVRP